jgi:hypothetical protein
MFDDEPCPAGARAANLFSKLPSGSRRRSAGREKNLLNRRTTARAGKYKCEWALEFTPVNFILTTP